jgi:cell division septum initiation protein DivIVA
MFDVNMAQMKMHRAGLDRMYDYKTAAMHEHMTFGHKPKVETERLDGERIKFQNRILGDLRALMATISAIEADEEAVGAEDGAEAEHGNEEQTVNNTTAKAHQATVEDFGESAEEPAVAMKGVSFEKDWW